jgi:hypothetical protein
LVSVIKSPSSIRDLAKNFFDSTHEQHIG